MSDNPGYTADFIKSDTDQATFMKDPAMDHLMTALVSVSTDIHFPAEIEKAGFTVREAKKGVLFFGRVHATRNA